ncbi:MAG: DUF45 domain-containing protein [Bacilli bacterium]|nr:DUF45 domain-containing protein [Bacilli bacterium]
MTYKINNKEYEVIVVRKNNKNTYLRVKDDLKIYITTGFFTNNMMIRKLLRDNESQIIKMINSQVKKSSRGEYFNYLGNSYHVFIDDVDGIKFLDDSIYVSSYEYLDKWLKKQIKNIFKERLDYNFNRYEEEIPYPKLKIRSMKTRWGVCNIRDDSVTLNSKLIEYDVSKLDYVIIHELSHFIYFNHSKKFWNQVSKYTPNYKQIRRELRD